MFRVLPPAATEGSGSNGVVYGVYGAGFEDCFLLVMKIYFHTFLMLRLNVYTKLYSQINYHRDHLEKVFYYAKMDITYFQLMKII